ncbi:MAG: peptide deformylase [Arenicellales bacterium]|jgi:peptide deformylase
MAVLDILVYPDQRLRQVAEPVDIFDRDLRRLIDDMAETMYQAPGIGLAAVQVDVPKRVVVMDISEQRNELREFVNPRVVDKQGSTESEEGCLSVPDVYAPVTRAERVVVAAQDRNGEPFSLEAEGLLAVCIQHEIDHLDGKVFVDYLSRMKRERIKKRLVKQARHDPQPATAAVL